MVVPKARRPVSYPKLKPRPKPRPQTFLQRVWAFFNTPLGLLVISSLILGSLGRVYADHQSNLQAAQKNREERESVDLELTARMSALSNYVRWIGDIDYLYTAIHPDALPDKNAYKISLQCMKAKLTMGPANPGLPKSPADIPGYPQVPREKLQEDLNDILFGKDTYEATRPEFQKVQMKSLLLQMDQLQGDKLAGDFIVSPDEPGVAAKAIVDQVTVSDAISALEQIDDSCLAQLFLEKLGWYMQLREGSATCDWDRPRSHSSLAKSTCHPSQVEIPTGAE